MTREQKERHIKVYNILKYDDWLTELFRRQDYYTIYRDYGQQVLLSHLEELEELEEYLRCADVIHFIHHYNKTNNTKIPTRL